jgi:hypothetical protein
MRSSRGRKRDFTFLYSKKGSYCLQELYTNRRC